MYVEVPQNLLTLVIVGVIVSFATQKSLFSYSLDSKKPDVKINYPYFDGIVNGIGLLVCKLRRKLGSQNLLLMLFIANCLPYPGLIYISQLLLTLKAYSIVYYPILAVIFN